MGAVIRQEIAEVIYQRPRPRIEILTPPYGRVTMELNPSNSAIGVTEAGLSQNLLSYTFSEGVDDLEGSFSFAIEDEPIGKDMTFFDLIPLRSVIKIYEETK